MERIEVKDVKDAKDKKRNLSTTENFVITKAVPIDNTPEKAQANQKK